MRLVQRHGEVLRAGQGRVRYHKPRMTQQVTEKLQHQRGVQFGSQLSQRCMLNRVCAHFHELSSPAGHHDMDETAVPT